MYRTSQWTCRCSYGHIVTFHLCNTEPHSQYIRCSCSHIVTNPHVVIYRTSYWTVIGILCNAIYYTIQLCVHDTSSIGHVDNAQNAAFGFWLHMMESALYVHQPCNHIMLYIMLPAKFEEVGPVCTHSVVGYRDSLADIMTAMLIFPCSVQWHHKLVFSLSLLPLICYLYPVCIAPLMSSWTW